MVWLGKDLDLALFSQQRCQQAAHSAPQSGLSVRKVGRSLVSEEEEGSSFRAAPVSSPAESMIAPCPVPTAGSIGWEGTSTLRENGKRQEHQDHHGTGATAVQQSVRWLRRAW